MTGARADAVAPLVRAVQTNCDIADARHAADMSLCIYLLQMREFYRWEKGLAFGAKLDRPAVGQWLAAREALWEDLEARPFEPLPFAERFFDPLDVARLNVELTPLGLVYGAGLAAADRPGFFVAQLERQQTYGDGLVLQVCGRELARGLFAPPAALASGQTIVVRRESLARWLWEKFEAFSLRRADGPYMALVDAYGLHDEAAFIAALPRLVDDQCETLVLHELGEFRAGQWLGGGWSAMRLALQKRRTDLLVRAVRDHIADFDVTLPSLIGQGDRPALHFWFSNYEGQRERLCPSLSRAYGAWRGGDEGQALRRAACAGVIHFRALAQQVLALHAELGGQAEAAIDKLLSAPEAICHAGV